MGKASVKSPFPAAEVKKWRALLVQKRQEITEDIRDLVKDAMDAEDGHVAPTHQADRGSDVDFQEMSLGMIGNEEEILWQIDRAIRKIDTGDPLPYGLCEHTQEPIPKTRLKLLPWTPISIDGANHMEQNNMTLYDIVMDA
jgi:RNA polymerase-binding transcription factor DksA